MPFAAKKGLFESNRVMFFPISSLVPNPAQPRQTFALDGLEELAASIREHGILQPLSVRRAGGRYLLIAGERRLRAAKLAGLREVPCILINTDEEASSVLALVENLQRRDLDFLEEAVALDRLIRTCGLSQQEAAKRIGKSQSAVANKLRLLRLPPDILSLLRQNGATERHARALLVLDDPEQQRAAARHLTEQRLTVERAEAYIEALRGSPPGKSGRRKPSYIIKDVRLFLNTVTRGLSLMKSAGVKAQYGQEETEDAILLTIRIPK